MEATVRCVFVEENFHQCLKYLILKISVGFDTCIIKNSNIFINRRKEKLLFLKIDIQFMFNLKSVNYLNLA